MGCWTPKSPNSFGQLPNAFGKESNERSKQLSKSAGICCGQKKVWLTANLGLGCKWNSVGATEPRETSWRWRKSSVPNRKLFPIWPLCQLQRIFWRLPRRSMRLGRLPSIVRNSGETITAAVAKEIVGAARTKTARKVGIVPANKLSVRLAKALEGFKERWDPKEVQALVRQLQEFVHRLESGMTGVRKGRRAQNT